MTDLAGHRVLVTGGGTGLGADLARGFAHAGADVWIAGRTEDNLRAVADRFDRVSYAVADVTQEASVHDLFDRTGPVDIVIANAGASESAPLAKTDLSAWTRMIDVNLTGVFLTFREALRRRDGKTDWGRLIAIASTAGVKGYPYVSAYTAAKHGVVGLVRAAALETARTGITVNALSPGFLDTEMTERSIANITAKTGADADDARATLERMSPQNRLFQPDEVTAAALWLCGSGSAGVTGQTIAIAGGEV